MSRLLSPSEIEALRSIEPHIPSPRGPLHIVIDAGHADLAPQAVAALEPGSLIPLDRKAGESVEIVSNSVTIAHGHLVEIDGRAAVRVASLVEKPAAQGRDRT